MSEFLVDLISFEYVFKIPRLINSRSSLYFDCPWRTSTINSGHFCSCFFTATLFIFFAFFTSELLNTFVYLRLIRIFAITTLLESEFITQAFEKIIFFKLGKTNEPFRFSYYYPVAFFKGNNRFFVGDQDGIRRFSGFSDNKGLHFSKIQNPDLNRPVPFYDQARSRYVMVHEFRNDQAFD